MERLRFINHEQALASLVKNARKYSICINVNPCLKGKRVKVIEGAAAAKIYVIISPVKGICAVYPAYSPFHHPVLGCTGVAVRR